MEVHVLHDEVDGFAVEDREPLRRRRRRHGLDVVQGEQHVERGGDGRVVVDDEHACHQRIASRNAAPWAARR